VIGDPAKRFAQDALRLLRVVRLRALLDGQYHPDTYRALQESAPLVASLSGERVRREFEKMLLGPRPDRALEDLWETGILKILIPELAACKGVAQPIEYHHEGDVWEHTLACVRAYQPEDGIDLRLAALFHDVGKPPTFALKERIRFDQHAETSADIVRTVFDRLQFPAVRRDAVAWLVGHHMMMGAFSTMPEARKAHWYYHPLFTDLLRLFVLDIAGTTPQSYELYDEVLREYNAYLDSHPRPPKPLLSGKDVMNILGIPPGERVGGVIQELLEEQRAGRITTKREAKAYVETLKK
jgi:poly(A) polymerase